MNASARIFTVGHSNRSPDALVALLRAAGVQAVADVRRFPRSRRWPWFDRAALEAALPAQGLAYRWLGDALGGYARPPYPAYVHTPAFAQGLARLEALARAAPLAVLCAERDWRHCHRRFIADALCRRGWAVVHLLDPDHREPHPCPLPGSQP